MLGVQGGFAVAFVVVVLYVVVSERSLVESLDGYCHTSMLVSFRDISDVNQYMFRFWQFMSGKFHPINVAKDSCRFTISDRDVDKLAEAIRTQKRDILVMADSEDFSDFNALVAKINSAFDTILPEKSSFEI